MFVIQLKRVFIFMYRDRIMASLLLTHIHFLDKLDLVSISSVKIIIEMICDDEP